MPETTERIHVEVYTTVEVTREGTVLVDYEVVSPLDPHVCPDVVAAVDEHMAEICEQYAVNKGEEQLRQDLNDARCRDLRGRL